MSQLCFKCGGVGLYFRKKSKTWSCSSHSSKCPAVKSKIHEIKFNRQSIFTTDLCEYGCGNTAKFIILTGKLCCEDYYTKCPTHLEMNRIGNTGRIYTAERNAKISKAKKGVPLKPEHAKQAREASIGMKHTAETRALWSSQRKGPKNPNYGKHMSNSTKQKISKKNKGKLLGEKNPRYGIPLCQETREKISKSVRKYFHEMRKSGNYPLHLREKIKEKMILFNGGVDKLTPNYNKNSIKIIKSYGRKFGYNFRHAETKTRDGKIIGEFYIKELNYWVDAYDEINNVVLEIDEPTHYIGGILRPKDVIRQQRIEEHLKCKFIRLKVNRLT